MSTSNPSGTPSTTSSPPTDNLSGSPTRKRSGTIGAGIAIAIAVILLIVGFAGGYFVGAASKTTSSTSKPSLTETGSSLLYPLMTSWAGNYSAATISAAATGSGTGQSDSELGLVNIGASDGYVKNASATGIINVPVAISAQLIYYNIPGVTAHLNLNGTILAMIYAGNITNWNNSWIAAANPGVTLPSATISPIVRSDSSGDTFLFSSMCYMSFKYWPFSYSTSALETDPHGTGAVGNSGMVAAIEATKNSIGYVGIAYESTAAGDGLVYAALGDNNSLSASGGVDAANYVLPSAANISADANLGLTHLEFSTYQLAVSLILGGSPYGAIDLVLGAGGTTPVTGTTPYPDANLEYTLIKTAPVAGSSVVTSTNLAATVQFIEWAISIGNWAPGSVTSVYLTNVHFIPLTPEVAGYDMQELASVQP